ncbi:hypothetical protein EDC04DRAFT_3026756 [Pisolithus marmoratus]|nr:hypothetical protein EDC04DRAFT_3026756 [Pisolithus marmoratus]
MDWSEVSLGVWFFGNCSLALQVKAPVSTVRPPGKEGALITLIFELAKSLVGLSCRPVATTSQKEKVASDGGRYSLVHSFVNQIYVFGVHRAFSFMRARDTATAFMHTPPVYPSDTSNALRGVGVLARASMNDWRTRLRKGLLAMGRLLLKEGDKNVWSTEEDFISWTGNSRDQHHKVVHTRVKQGCRMFSDSSGSAGGHDLKRGVPPSRDATSFLFYAVIAAHPGTSQPDCGANLNRESRSPCKDTSNDVQEYCKTKTALTEHLVYGKPSNENVKLPLVIDQAHKLDVSNGLYLPVRKSILAVH